MVTRLGICFILKASLLLQFYVGHKILLKKWYPNSIKSDAQLEILITRTKFDENFLFWIDRIILFYSAWHFPKSIQNFTEQFHTVSFQSTFIPHAFALLLYTCIFFPDAFLLPFSDKIFFSSMYGVWFCYPLNSLKTQLRDLHIVRGTLFTTLRYLVPLVM